jgi:hypothetical protein
LLGLGGYFLYAQIDQEHQITEALNAQTEQMETLDKKDPQPGNAKVNNIEAAKEQKKELEAFLVKARKAFVPVPHPTNMDGGQFKILLENTLDELRRSAANAGVKLPQDYAFTFAAEKPLMSVEAKTVQPLTDALLTIEAISKVIFDARVLALDGIRRVSITAQDTPSPTPGQSDYWSKKPETNELAIITPYEFTFHCFTAELAAVLQGLATNRYCFIVKNVTVDTTPSSVLDTNVTANGEAPSATPAMDSRYLMMMRYGRRYFPNMPAAPPPEAVSPGGRPPIKRGGMTVVLDEKPFRVVLRVDAVRLFDKNGSQAGASAKPARAARGGPAPGDPANQPPTAGDSSR